MIRKHAQRGHSIKAMIIYALLVMCAAFLSACDSAPEKDEAPFTHRDASGTSPEDFPNPSATNPSAWNLLLVNPWNQIPSSFSVTLAWLEDGHSIDMRAYWDTVQMLADARAEGLSPIVCSSFRTSAKQQSLYENKVNRLTTSGYSRANAEIEAAKWVAYPGTSEHQCGLALDIVASSYRNLDEKQEKTAEQKWLMQNSYKYGFILRYPSNKSDITGIEYEPWHYRYVGKDAAKAIYDAGICLEEYLLTLKK